MGSVAFQNLYTNGWSYRKLGLFRVFTDRKGVPSCTILVILLSTYIGPMKGVILTPNIAKMFHTTLNIEGKKCLTPEIQTLPRHSTLNFKSMSRKCHKNVHFCLDVKLMKYRVVMPSRHSTLWFSDTIKYLNSTLDTDSLSRALVMASCGYQPMIWDTFG